MPVSGCLFFFFNDTATTEIYTLSLHDALPIFTADLAPRVLLDELVRSGAVEVRADNSIVLKSAAYVPKLEPSEKLRSEEHTSELQSPCNLVCRLLLEKKKNIVTREPRRAIKRP